MQLIPTVSQTPAGGTGSSRGPESARRPRMLLGPCGRRRVDASGESAGCSAKAREKVQDRRRRMFLGCPQQLPRPAAPKAAHFTPQAATGHGLGAPSSPPSTHLAASGAGAKSQSLRRLGGSAPGGSARLLLRHGDAPAPSSAVRPGQDGGERRGGSLQPYGLSRGLVLICSCKILIRGSRNVKEI